MRPALRCVTRRTLTSVLARLRSISFCRFLTFGQSSSLLALKIRCRSRATSRSGSAQTIESHSSALHPTGRSSGPFTMRRLTCPQFGRFPHLVFKGSPAHVSTLSRPAPTGIRPVIRDGQRRSQPHRLVFLPPSGHQHSLPGHPCRPGNYAPLTTGLPAARSRDGWTRTRFPCSARVRHDRGWPSPPPRGRRCPHGQKSIFGRRLPPLNGPPLPPCAATRHQGVRLTRHQQGFTGIQPTPSPPLTRDPRTDRGPPGLYPELRTQPDKTQPRTSGQGQTLDTGPDYVTDLNRSSSDVLTQHLRPHVALLKATPKGPRRGPGTRLTDGLQRP